MLTRFQIFLDFDEASLIRPNLTSFHLVLSGQLPQCSPLPAAADSLQGPCPVSLGWLHCEPSAHRFLRVAWSKSWGSIQLASCVYLLYNSNLARLHSAFYLFVIAFLDYFPQNLFRLWLCEVFSPINFSFWFVEIYLYFLSSIFTRKYWLLSKFNVLFWEVMSF